MDKPLPAHAIMLSALGREIGCKTFGDVEITGITHDSAQVQPGDLFVAIPGLAKHGIEFLDQAIKRGAVAVASDQIGIDSVSGKDIPWLKLTDPRRQMALASSVVFGHPEAKLKIVGVTGTNGKTTVTHMIKDLLSSAGHRVGLIGTLGTFVTDELIHSVRTTPESTDLYALLANMVDRDIEIVVMEVSSHALELMRVEGLIFDVAVFTNLSQDHLDFHQDMNSYFAAKTKLFSKEKSKFAIICTDDEWGQRLADSLQIAKQTVGQNGSPDILISQIEQKATHSDFQLQINQQEFTVALNRLGKFNVVNAVQALAVATRLGVTLESALSQLSTLAQVPGRLEMLNLTNGAVGIVDYAHTPDAVDKVLTELRQSCQGRIISVLGCGGDRDKSKRPQMGKIGSDLSDFLIVTDDNPRSESADEIRKQVLSETNSNNTEEIADRRLAIRSALAMSTKDDFVIVLGKGHEQGQEISGIVYPFDDRDVILQESKNA